MLIIASHVTKKGQVCTTETSENQLKESVFLRVPWIGLCHQHSKEVLNERWGKTFPWEKQRWEKVQFWWWDQEGNTFSLMEVGITWELGRKVPMGPPWSWQCLVLWPHPSAERGEKATEKGKFKAYVRVGKIDGVTVMVAMLSASVCHASQVLLSFGPDFPHLPTAPWLRYSYSYSAGQDRSWERVFAQSRITTKW